MKSNLRILTVNCRSIVGKSAEFAATLDYIKPDIVCGTESWLKGIQPGKNPTTDTITSSEIFPSNYRVYRNDRGTRGGGVFILVHEDIVSVEQPNFVTECEVDWAKIQIKDNKDLYIGVFYMPHRKLEYVDQLDQSLDKLSRNKSRQIYLCGDFNCPDTNWDLHTVEEKAQDRAVQQALVDLAAKHSLSQVHDTPTREENLLDLVFTSNPSLTKASVNVPGISDHAMVVTDSELKPHYVQQKARKRYTFKKSDWPSLKLAAKQISDNIQQKSECGENVENLWDAFKNDLLMAVDHHVPASTRKPQSSVPWLTGGLKRMLKTKRRLYNRAKITKNWTRYRHIQKRCR